MNEVGRTFTLKRRLTQSMFDRFAALSGDDNPIHVDPDFAARTRFGRTVAHGMFLYSIISCALTQFAGPGVLPLSQDLMFPAPTFTGETMTVRLEVVDTPHAAGTLLSTTITRPDGIVTCQGQALFCIPGETAVIYPDLPASQPAEADTVPLKGLQVGQRAAVQRTFHPADVAAYVDLTGDTNPLYTDAAFAQAHGFNGPLLPGGLLAGLFSYLLGTHLPGRGTNWLKQKLVFPAPAYAGELISAEVEIIRLRPPKDLVNLRTVCANPAGAVICAGEALVLIKELQVTSQEAPM